MPKKDYQNREVGIWILFRKKDSTVLLYSVFAFSSVKYNPSVSDGKINNFIFNGSIFKVFLYRVMHFFLIFANVIIIVQQINTKYIHMNSIKIKILALLAIFTAIGCSPDKDDYTEKWVGNWQTTDETAFPQTKYLHTGAITKSSEGTNRIIIDGTLLGINSSYQIPAKVSSETDATIDYTNNFRIVGTAKFNNKDTIWLRLNISQNNKSVNDTLILTKIK